jgi:hypothetical protein
MAGVARDLPSRSMRAGNQAGRPTRKGDVKRFIAAVLALAATSPLGAGEPLTIRVSPRVAMAPATLVIDAVAEQDPANRALQIQVDSADYYRGSLVQLDGEQAPRTTTVRYEGLPGGTYEVRATLLGSNGKPRASTNRQVNIISIAGQ